MTNEKSGFEKARETVEKIKSEIANTPKDKTLEDYSNYSDVGMNNIDAEDIMPPTAFLVQGIDNKSELVDSEGNECPDGSFYLKGMGEIFNNLEGYMVYIKKTHFEGKNGPDALWEGTRVYRTIIVRKKDMMPISITFKKSSQSAVSDLLTASKSTNRPIFMFKINLKVVDAVSKMGKNYFKASISVGGLEDDKEVLERLFALAKGFDASSDQLSDQDDFEKLAEESLLS